MEGAATVMASPTPDPATYGSHTPRHGPPSGPPPSGGRGDEPGFAAPQQPQPQHRGTAAQDWWNRTEGHAGGYSSTGDGSYQPTQQPGGGYAGHPSAGGYGLPHQQGGPGGAADAAWYRDQAAQQYTRAPVEEPSPFELALPELRSQVVNALIRMNWKHASEAWQRRRRDPLSAHALVFFYAEPPTGQPPRCELRTAARLFLAADGKRLAMLLYEMVGVARDHLAAGRDPRTHIFSTHEPMSMRARYVGLGVSSLDTPAGTWDEVQRSASTDMDVPGRCYARLIDTSTMLVDRLAMTEFGVSQVLTTHPTYSTSRQRQRRWDFDRDLAESTDFDPEFWTTWQWLIQLHDVFLRR